MKIFLVNLNNLPADGFEGAVALQKTDKIILLCEENANISILNHIAITKLKCLIDYRICNISSDLEYGFYLGKLISKDKNLIIINPSSEIRNAADSLGIKVQDDFTLKKEPKKSVVKKVTSKTMTENYEIKPSSELKPTNDAEKILTAEEQIRNIIFKAGQRHGKSIIAQSGSVFRSAQRAKGDKHKFEELLIEACGEDKTKQILSIIEDDLITILSLT